MFSFSVLGPQEVEEVPDDDGGGAGHVERVLGSVLRQFEA